MTFNIVHSLYFFVLLQSMVESTYILTAGTVGKYLRILPNFRKGVYFSVIN